MMKARIGKFIQIISILLVFVFIRHAFGISSNIDSTDKWAWNDIAGWIDFYDSDNGAYVGSTKLSKWGVFDNDNNTYVALHCTALPPAETSDCTPNFGVINDGNGSLSNYAWSDGYGWISFCGGASTADCPGTVNYQVTIDSGGFFQGFAWNDIIGWISFNCVNHGCGIDYKVKSAWNPYVAGGTTDNYLESVTFDTESSSGFAINSIYWEGTHPAGSVIGFQLAVSTSTDFTGVDFIGPDNSVSTIYTIEDIDVDGIEAITVNSLYHHPFESGYRYFRYRVYLNETGTSPTVTKVSVNWTK